MYIFPWSDLLELFIVNQLSIMYTPFDTDANQIGYHTTVHFLPGVWASVIVDNPLKNHMSRFNASLRDLNERYTRLFFLNHILTEKSILNFVRRGEQTRGIFLAG